MGSSEREVRNTAKEGRFDIPSFLVEKDVEEAVLGTLIRYPELLEQALEWVDAEPFFIPLHRKVWGVLREEAIFSPPEHSLILKGLLKSRVPSLSEAVLSSWEEKADPDLIPEALIYLVDLDTRRRTYLSLEGALKTLLKGEAPEVVLEELSRSLGDLYAPLTPAGLEGAYERALRLLEGGRRIPTGFKALDKHLLGGLPKGGMSVLGARPSVGKTSFARKVVRHVLERGGRVYWASFDQASEQILLMEAALRCGQPYALLADFPSGRAQIERALAELVSAYEGRWILDDRVASARTLASRVKRVHKVYPIDLVVVDYLQFLPSDTPKGDLERVSETSRILKRLAIELDLAVLALAQLSRSVEYRSEKQPVLADLRDSGQIEQDADVVLALHRDTALSGSTPVPAKVLVLKNKVGPTGEVLVEWDPAFAEYRDSRED